MHGQEQFPVTLRVGQVMTGFGAGCGIGLGVGYPIPLGSVPLVGDLMSATSSASSRAFGGIGRHAFSLLNKLGVKSLKAGVGCGVGVGHGFGVGFALKPGSVSQMLIYVQNHIAAVASEVQKRMNISGADHAAEASQNLLMNVHPVVSPDQSAHEGTGRRGSTKNIEVQTNERFLSSSHSNSLLAKADPGIGTSHTAVEKLHAENDILRMLLRHQEAIDHIKEENAALMQEFHQRFGVSPMTGTGNNIHNKYVFPKNCQTCDWCIRCRRRDRRRR